MSRITGSILVALTVAGCAPTSNTVTRAHPRGVGDNYYMMGDPACAAVREHKSEAKVLCHTIDGKPTGEVRKALTTQQIQMWQYNQQVERQRLAQARADRAALVQQMQQTAASIQQSTPQYTYYPTPQVAPVVLPRTNVISCISTSNGFYTNCRW